VINFGAIDFSPTSGNQDAEFIQLVNTNSIAVDISDWRLTGGIEHTFAPGTVLAPKGALYVCPNAAAFRARTGKYLSSQSRSTPHTRALSSANKK